MSVFRPQAAKQRSHIIGWLEGISKAHRNVDMIPYTRNSYVHSFAGLFQNVGRHIGACHFENILYLSIALTYKKNVAISLQY
jgi:hypothetical protein